MNLDGLAGKPCERTPLWIACVGRVTQVVGTVARGRAPAKPRSAVLCTVGRGNTLVRGRSAFAASMHCSCLSIPSSALAHGDPVEVTRRGAAYARWATELLGRVLDAPGSPGTDGAGGHQGASTADGHSVASDFHEIPLHRDLISKPMETGVRVLDGLLAARLRASDVSITASARG